MAADITLDDFTTEARAFLDANAEKRPAHNADDEFVWGQGDDGVAVLEDVDRDAEANALARAKQWRATRFDNGFGWIQGPLELGGRGLSAAYERAYGQLEAQYVTPDTSFFGIGLGMVAPTIVAHAQPHIVERYVAKMYRGDIVGAQLFSEPGAGSDLAGLQMRAIRDGEEWVVTGQKVWTSGAHYSDIGEIICRTDPDVPKHKGLTGFVVDLGSPGIEIRPLRQMTGGASFNEVFFNEVRVPDDHRLGDVNGGWTVALTTLMNERASIGGGGIGGGGGIASGTRLMAMLSEFGKVDDPVLRNRFAEVYIGFQVAKYTNLRASAKLKAGGLPGPEMSIGKLALTANLWNVAQFAAEVLGPRICANTGEWGTYSWNGMLLGVPGLRIAGGTDEVMRNIIGERVLGLPKEPDISKNQPFRDVLVGTQRSEG
ncbi:MAG TPA: acyl-CoA dehydrogenase family protein [Acidimicrobiales bacterium]